MNKYQEALNEIKTIDGFNDLYELEKKVDLLQELVDMFNDDAIEKAWLEGYLKCQEEYGL